MVYSQKCAFWPYAVFLAATFALEDCVDIWSASRCSNQKRKGNCVPEAQCPNPKKDGIKCTRARSQCMATCRLCDEDSASTCAAAYADGYANGVASMTPPPPPPGADYPCDTAYNLLTLTQAYDWCATHCDGRTVKVITGDEDVDFSDESGGVCAIADTTVNGDQISVDVTLTEHDDCFVVVGGEDESGTATGFGFQYTYGSPKLFGRDGNDVLCGGSGGDNWFYGGDGDDLLAGGPGRDLFMHGDAGADKIFGGLGDDLVNNYGSPLYGGEGEDSIYADPGDDAMDDDEFHADCYENYDNGYDCS